MDIPVANIDEDRLYTDLGYRFQYLCDFIGISEDDIKLIHGSAIVLGPKVDVLVDAVYDKLFAFSCTKKVFFKERTKHDTPDDKATLESYDFKTKQIAMRKTSLKNYLVRLVTKPYDETMLKTLDRMGKIHTPKGGKLSINVELIHMQALLAFVQDAVIATLYAYKESSEEGAADFEIAGTIRAFGKVLAVQNQFISRWYEDPAVSRVTIPRSSVPMFLPVVALTGALTAALTYFTIA